MKTYKKIPTSFISERTFEVKDNIEKLYNALKASIVKYGQIRTIMVRELGADKYEVIEGNKIFRILKEIGCKEIFCYNMGEVDDEKAKAIYLQTQVLENNINYLKLSEMLCALKDIPANNLSQMSIFDIEEIKEIMNLSSYDWQQFLKDEKEIMGQETLF